MQREYRIDLRDIGTPALTWRRAMALIRGLPPHGTCLARALHGEAGEWGPADWMLADIVDASYLHAWAFIVANSTKQAASRIDKPSQAYRPGMLSAQPKRLASAPKYSTADQIKSFFGGPGTTLS